MCENQRGGEITFLSLIMQIGSAEETAYPKSKRHCTDSYWPSWENLKGWTWLTASLPTEFVSVESSLSILTIEVLGPHQVLVCIFKQISFLFFSFEKIGPAAGIYFIHPCAEVGDLSGWKSVRILICIESTRDNTQIWDIKWLWIFSINYSTG